MSLHVLATGTLTADPQSRTSKSGNDFAIGNIRVATGEGEPVFVSLIAFADKAPNLLGHRQGSTIAVAGRATFKSWTGKDGAEKHGLSVVVEQIVSAAAARRAEASRRRERDQ
jgi:single-stranded DNA-binding protein